MSCLIVSLKKMSADGQKTCNYNRIASSKKEVTEDTIRGEGR